MVSSVAFPPPSPTTRFPTSTSRREVRPAIGLATSVKDRSSSAVRTAACAVWMPALAVSTAASALLIAARAAATFAAACFRREASMSYVSCVSAPRPTSRRVRASCVSASSRALSACTSAARACVRAAAASCAVASAAAKRPRAAASAASNGCGSIVNSGSPAATVCPSRKWTASRYPPTRGRISTVFTARRRAV